jgi:hypothetical protein
LMVEVRHYLKRRCQQALGSSAVPKEPRTEAPENRAR